MPLRALFILDSDYDSLVAKGVIASALNRDEDGLFENVFTVHPFATHDRDIDLADNHLLIEFRQDTSPGTRPILWLRHFLHLTRVWLALVCLVRRERINLVRAQDPYYCGILGWSICQVTRAKFCVSIHTDYDRAEGLDPVAGVPRLFGSRAAAKRLERFILGRAQRILAISTYIGDYARCHGADPEKIRIFRHRVKLSAGLDQVNSRTTHASSPCPVIAVVSRLTDQKHIMDIPVIARLLRGIVPEFRFEIAGDGEARFKLEAAIEAEGLERHVQLLGFQDSARVHALLNRASAYLSLCSGAALIEAGAAGTPTVAYDWEWHSELILDGETGILIPENDYAEAAHALARLLCDTQLASRMGMALRNCVFDEFEEGRLLKAHRAVYREMLEGGTIDATTRYVERVAVAP